jgi:uncharacterized protein YuzE
MERELKANELIVSPIGKFDYQIIPLTDIQIIVTREELQKIKNRTKCFDLENNCVIDYDNTEDLEKERIEKLRRLREPLLVAFDKYKSNVVYGVEIENEKQRLSIIEWYNAIKNLSENAIENIPDKIKYYL